MEPANIKTILVPRGPETAAITRGLKRVSGYRPVIVPIPAGSRGLSEWLSGRGLSTDFLNKTLLTGLAGSLSAAHRVGDAVVYEGCGDGSGKYLECDREVVEFLAGVLGVPRVRGLTSDAVVTRAAEKTRLAELSGMEVVDMEGLRLLEARPGLGMVRVISDGVSRDLPDIGDAIDPRGNLRPLALAREMLKAPVPAWHLIDGSLRGLRALEDVIYRLFRSG